LKGESPILEQYYSLQHKAWTQALHHTAAGMDITFGKQGEFPVVVARPAPFLILFGNYWVFGQLIFASLELGGEPSVLAYFEKLFLAGIAVFSEAVGLSVWWEDRLEEWAADPYETGGGSASDGE
jgi:hypothetical protein